MNLVVPFPLLETAFFGGPFGARRRTANGGSQLGESAMQSASSRSACGRHYRLAGTQIWRYPNRHQRGLPNGRSATPSSPILSFRVSISSAITGLYTGVTPQITDRWTSAGALFREGARRRYWFSRIVTCCPQHEGYMHLKPQPGQRASALHYRQPFHGDIKCRRRHSGSLCTLTNMSGVRGICFFVMLVDYQLSRFNIQIRHTCACGSGLAR